MLINNVFILDRNTKLIPPSNINNAIEYALDIFERDQIKVFEEPKSNQTNKKENSVSVSV